MFFLSKRVRRDPHNRFLHDPDEPIRLDEARLNAWALALGQRRGDEGTAFNAHRWLLPDADFSRPTSIKRRQDLVPGLKMRLFGGQQKPGASETASGAVADDHAALGESRLKAYVRLIETEATGKAAPRAPAATRKQSRAA